MLSSFLIFCVVSSSLNSVIGTAIKAQKRADSGPAIDPDLPRPDGWWKLGSSLYYFSQVEETNDQARKRCENMGAKLVEIETELEHDLLASEIYGPQKVRGYFWLGAKYIGNKWKWNSGGDLTVFKFWDPQQTNNHVSSYSPCLYTQYSPAKVYWRETNCDYKFDIGALCEKSL